MQPPGPGQVHHSATWSTGPVPRIAVVVPTHGRVHYLDDLLDRLQAQDLPLEQFEVVVVDDASPDDTWNLLVARTATTPVRLCVARHATNRGPAATRNHGVAVSRAPYLAFTDDDCLPHPGWLSAMLVALESGAPVVQGHVEPPADDWATAGPWDHTIFVRRPSPFFETANVGYDRDRFLAVGGFADGDPLLTPEQGRGFGEDADLAWRVLRQGGERAFAPDARVDHRVVPGTFRRWVRGQRHTVGFPGLARRSPIFGAWLRGGVFLSRQSASFDLAVAATVAAVASRRAWPLLGTLPWGWVRSHDAVRATRGDRRRALRVLVQLGVADAVTLLSLLEGSVRHRRLVL